MQPNSNYPPRSYGGGSSNSYPQAPSFSRFRHPPAPAPPRPRPEDAQPSEAITSNRRPSAPPPVVPTSQTTFAGGWSNSSSTASTNGQVQGSRWNGTIGGNGSYHAGSRWNENSVAGSFRNRPRPQTTAGGWSTSSSSTPSTTTNGTVAGKGKERQWGMAPSLVNSSNRPSLNPTPTLAPTPVPVPINPRPRVWVSQLPPSVTEEELRTVFSPFGQIERINVNLKPNANYAYAHVTYSQIASATDAITSLNLQPFPSLNGVGSSRPIRVEYASPPRNPSLSESDGRTTGRNLAVTTEPPTAETSIEVENRLFRARETPEFSQNQSIKREMESPVKRMDTVAEEGRDGRGARSRSRSRSGSDSSRFDSTAFRRSPRRTSTSSLHDLSSDFSVNSNAPHPPFINPPKLTFQSVKCEPTRLGTLLNDVPSYVIGNNRRRYSVSYGWSNRLVSYRSKRDLAKRLRSQLSRHLNKEASLQLYHQSIRINNEEFGDVVGSITFDLELSKRALVELGRTDSWLEEEEEKARTGIALMEREIQSKLGEVEQGPSQDSTYLYIEPPSLSFNQIPLPPSRIGTLVPSTPLPTYSLHYLYPVDLLFSAFPPLSLADFETRIRERVKASGMRLLSIKMNVQPRMESGTFSPKRDEEVVEVRVEFISSGMVSFLGRNHGWSQDELENVQSAVNNMRRTSDEKRRDPVTREEEEPQRQRREETTTNQEEGPQPDGTIIQRIPLPSALVGAGPDQLRKQTLLRVEEVKKRSSEGKVVLSSSIDGNFITICYFIDDSTDLCPPSPRTAATVSNGDVRPTSGQEDIEMAQGEDVKPVLPNDGEKDMEIDQLDSPTPEPAPSPTVKFPLGILRNSRADSIETYQAATTFIHDYFTRFDSSRSSLEGLYTRNAFFSLKVDTTTPRRLTTPITLFSRVWFQAANKFASTPIAITNAIRHLPAGSHNIGTILFNARTIPEFHLKKRGRAPILLHVTGEFEEFPEKTVRRFERTFVLVLSGIGSGDNEGSRDFIVHSDQLLIGHKADGEPRDLDVLDPPFRPSSNAPTPSRAPPVIESRAAPTMPNLSSPPPPHPSRNQVPPVPQAHVRPVASTSTPSHNSDSRPTLSAPRDSNSNARQIPTSSSPHQPSNVLPAAITRRLSQGEILVLSDSESAASRQFDSEPPTLGLDEGESNPSMSPEVSRPAKRPNLDNGNRRSSDVQRREETAPDLSPASSVSITPSTSNNQTPPPRPPLPTNASQSRRSSNNLGKRKASDLTQSAPALPPTTTSTNVAETGRQPQFLPEEIQRFIAEQVAKEVQEKLRAAGGDQSSSEPAKKKRIKIKEKEKEKDQDASNEKEKKKKTREKKDKFADGLGTGLSAGDSRIVIAGQGHSILHGFDGRSNKLRGMVQTADASSFLSVSFLGDIAEWSMQPLNSMTNSSITKLYSSNQDKFRVDDFTYNQAKDTLLVAYLGAKEGKEMACPPNQVVLYKRDTTTGTNKLVETRLTDAPHVNGGVTAIMALPNKVSTGRLRFVTGGEDKKVYLWTRQRSTQEVKLEKFVTEHTSMITSFAYLDARNELVSAGKDRRVVTYDLERKESTWQAVLSTAVMSVSPVLCDPNLILSRLATPSDQFVIHDRRLASTSPPIVTFGYDLPPHRSTNGALLPTNMGRYPRGDQIDTVVAFPDHDQGVKLWDLRQLKSEIVKKQNLPGLGRSKVVQASFKGRNELCLMELAHFSRLSIKG